MKESNLKFTNPIVEELIYNISENYDSTISPIVNNKFEVNVGKFGPYIKQGLKSRSLTGSDNIFNITLERALELLQTAQEKPQGEVIGKDASGNEIVLSSGRYGPYIKCGKNNYALPKELKGKQITLEDAIKIIQSKN